MSKVYNFPKIFSLMELNKLMQNKPDMDISNVKTTHTNFSIINGVLIKLDGIKKSSMSLIEILRLSTPTDTDRLFVQLDPHYYI